MAAEIERCLSSLLSDLSGSGLTFNITVTDNDSRDRFAEEAAAKFPAVKILKQTDNLGFGKAHNLALNGAAAKYHFILNPDTRFLPGQKTVRALYDFMEAHPKIGLIGPKLVYPDGSLQYSCYRFPFFLQPVFSRTRLGQTRRGKKFVDHYLMKDFDHRDIRPVDWVMGSAMFIRAAALEKVGGFDERYWMYAEDSDLCRRFWEAGYPVYYVPTVTLEHVHGRGSAQVPGVIWPMIKNNLARAHVLSWLKYIYKWRGNLKYYGK